MKSLIFIFALGCQKHGVFSPKEPEQCEANFYLPKACDENYLDTIFEIPGHRERLFLGSDEDSSVHLILNSGQVNWSWINYGIDERGKEVIISKHYRQKSCDKFLDYQLSCQKWQ